MRRVALRPETVLSAGFPRLITRREFLIQGVASGCGVPFQFGLWVAAVNGWATSTLIYEISDMLAMFVGSCDISPRSFGLPVSEHPTTPASMACSFSSVLRAASQSSSYTTCAAAQRHWKGCLADHVREDPMRNPMSSGGVRATGRVMPASTFSFQP
jgi:hypothetical protein